MRKLAQINRPKLIELLTERLTFERVGVRLYDAIVSRLESAEPAVRRMLPRVEQQRAEEREHVAWLEALIDGLASDAPPIPRRPELAHLWTEGLLRISEAGAATIAELFQALHTFELANESGWQRLLRLAERGHDLPACDDFGHRLADEQAHVSFVRHALTELLVNEVLGSPVTLPIGP